MQFIAQPYVFDAEFLLQRIDNALADITERSDVVGKDSHLNDHYPYSFQTELYSDPNLVPGDPAITILFSIIRFIMVTPL